MSTRIATFNVENLFDRPKAFNEDEAPERRVAIEAVGQLNAILDQSRYGSADKRKLLQLVDKLQLNRFNEGPFALIRTIRGQLIRRPRGKPPVVEANGRSGWIGWAELKTAPVNEIAVRNTGRVIRDVDADILAVIEAENRILLEQFSTAILRHVSEELPEEEQPEPYRHIMLIDGNDRRGIDVGLMTKPGYPIVDMRSHIDDRTDDGRQVFSRDCPEFGVVTPGGERLWILPNHFKSKFGGNTRASSSKRRIQSQRVAEIYRELRNRGESRIAVVGDLNDTPDSDPLDPLLRATDLRDVTEHPAFDVGEFNANNGNRGIGTFKLGNDKQKIDYLLLSPDLFARVEAAGMFRKGAWPGSNPPRWTVYPELKHEVHVASDHHVIWVDLEI